MCIIKPSHDNQSLNFEHRWREQSIKGLKPGDSFVFQRTFRKEDTEAFGDLTRDYNPVHYDQRFTRGKGMDGLICHGLLVGGMLCQIGGQLAWLASSMDFRYLKPVYFGDTITCRVTVTSINERQRAKAKAEFENQHGERVLEAYLGGVLPGPEERELLARMIAEGDPTNKLAGS